MYTTLTIADNEYKLRLTSASVIELEKKLGGRNPLDILMNIEKGALPPLTETLQILHAAMQKFNHGITFNKTMDLYDLYIDTGGSYTDLLPPLIEVFKVSGFFKVAPTVEAELAEESQ